MQVKNTPEKFGVVTKGFHWLTALLVVTLLCVGLYMVRAEKNASLIQLYGLHKSFGVTVLTLTFFRMLWHVYTRKPAIVTGLPKWEQWAAHTGHFFLYICLFGMPLSGWLMSSAFGRTVSFFGLFSLPDLIGQDQARGAQLAALHEYLAYALIGMIAIHVGAALRHHFFIKDATLKRMLPFGNPQS
ncbi:MAG TPA: cytochrome b [Patescibacteria group bacterium]|nr:cytochrome b [Patescibacteria group bacterium]